MTYYYYYECPDCGKILRRSPTQVRNVIQMCGKHDKTVKLRRVKPLYQCLIMSNHEWKLLKSTKQKYLITEFDDYNRHGRLWTRGRIKKVFMDWPEPKDKTEGRRRAKRKNVTM